MCLLKVQGLLHAKSRSHRSRLHIRIEVDGNRAEVIFDDNRRHLIIQAPARKDPRCPHELAAEVQARLTVVIASDVEDLDVHLCHLHEEFVKEVDRLNRRHAAVVDIPRNDDSIHLFLLHERHQLPHDDLPLIRRQVHPMEIPPEMPVSRVNKAHMNPSCSMIDSLSSCRRCASHILVHDVLVRRCVEHLLPR